MIDTNNNCASCRFYAAHLEDERDGVAQSECRRYPPTIVGVIMVTSDFPMVTIHDWCGEFRQRQESPMADNQAAQSASPD